MKRSSLFTLLLFTGMSAFAQQAQPGNSEGLPTRTISKDLPTTTGVTAITHRIIDAPNGTFGYEIMSDGKLFVRQVNIPGQPGNSGCAAQADAEKLAALVMSKIQKGEMPPTVTTAELKNMNIIR